MEQAKNIFLGFQIEPIRVDTEISYLPKIKAFKATLISPGRKDFKIFVGSKHKIRNLILEFWRNKLNR